jgi:hypothetical protein
MVQKLGLLGLSICFMLLSGELLIRYLIPAWPFEPALYLPEYLAQLLPFCEAADGKMLPCLVAVPVLYAAGARAYGIISCNGCESFEHSWGSACV